MSASPSTIARRAGIRLDAERFDFELGRRGLSARGLAELAGIPEVTISRARHGRPVREATLKALVEALLKTPLLIGAEMLIAEPETKTVQAASLAKTVSTPAGREVHSPDAAPAG